MAGARVVKAFSRRNRRSEDFRRLNLDLVEKNNELNRVTSVFYPLMQFVIGLAIVIVLWFGGREVVQDPLRGDNFVQFIFYLGTLAWPMIALGWVVNLLERGRASMQRLNYILDTEPDVRDESDVQSGFEVRGRDRVSESELCLQRHAGSAEHFAEDPERKDGCDRGRDGLGKVLAGSADPPAVQRAAETLFIDGVPIERIPLETLRRAIGFIPQDTFLFGETIRENIAFGVEDAPDSRSNDAAAVSNILADIQEFPQDSRPWSASGALRCPAVRSSGPPFPAR